MQSVARRFLRTDTDPTSPQEGPAMKVGILTGGGDCPGLNAVIRASSARREQGSSCIGILEGGRPCPKADKPSPPSPHRRILGRGGTILGSSRTNPYKKPDVDLKAVLENVQKLGLDALVAIGGDDTLGVAHQLNRDHKLNVVGVPKTIDNDSRHRLHLRLRHHHQHRQRGDRSAADDHQSHRRIMVVETMGRHAGWITCSPASPSRRITFWSRKSQSTSAELVDVLRGRRAAGKAYGIVVVSEGAKIPDQE